MGQRKKLNIVHKNSVIAQGFGSITGKFKVGKVVSSNNRAVKVEFNDKDGNYLEFFNIETGIRVDDIGQSFGWKIRKSDWEKEEGSYLTNKDNIEKISNKGSRLVKLHKGDYPLSELDGNTQNLIIEVWKDNEIGGLYLKVCREISNKVKNGVVKKKQVPALVPFSVLVKVMEHFKI